MRPKVFGANEMNWSRFFEARGGKLNREGDEEKLKGSKSPSSFLLPIVTDFPEQRRDTIRGQKGKGAGREFNYCV